MEKSFVIVGGSNIDVCSKSDASVVMHDSNIGHVEFGLGGVGRNIAEDLCLFGADVSLLTSIGDDGFGRVVSDRADEVGMKLLIPPFKDCKTGVYSYVSDNDGSFVIGVNDMGITEKITPQVIDENVNALLFADYVILEANLNVETIKRISELNVKIIADCVSGMKCKKVSDVLDKLYLLKSNKTEAFELSGKDNCKDAVKELINRGVKRGIITLGTQGAMCYEKKENGIAVYTLENMPKEKAIVDSNGCGDAFIAGFAFGIMRGHNMKESLYYGQSAAHLNAMSLSSVNREMTYLKLKDMIAEFKNTVAVTEEII